MSAGRPTESAPDDPGSRGYQRDVAYERFRQLLSMQQIREGERLREKEWAERLGVNRTALREAFARLAAEGLITMGTEPGYIVPCLTEAAVEEIIEVRLALEGGAIKRILQLGLNTPRLLKPVRECCDQMERLVREEYHLAVPQADRRFHESLVDAAGNQRLLMLYSRPPIPLIHPMLVSGKEWADNIERTIAEHRKILVAIQQSDLETALEALRIHLLHGMWLRTG